MSPAPVIRCALLALLAPLAGPAAARGAIKANPCWRRRGAALASAASAASVARQSRPRTAPRWPGHRAMRRVQSPGLFKKKLRNHNAMPFPMQLHNFV